MDFRERFSCRSFVPDDELPRELVVGLVDAARWAPNGGNLQPWQFVVVADPSRKRDLAAAALGQGFVAAASVVIVVCALPEVSARHYGERGRSLYCLQDTAAATENLLLAATAAGLGSCWVGAFDEGAVARALELPAAWRPVALVPVGRPREAPPRRSRHPLERIVVWM